MVKKEVSAWGNDGIQLLVSQFGVEQRHSFEDDEVVSPPIINPVETLNEWQLVKDVVLTQHYPCDSTAKLWELVAVHHKDPFPNLYKLAALASSPHS